MIVRTEHSRLEPFDSSLGEYLPGLDASALLDEAVKRVLTLPAVGSKSFLITIGGK